MKYFIKILMTTILLLLITGPVFSEKGSIEFTQEELQWVEEHKDEVLNLALDRYSGMEYFQHQGQNMGYLIDVVKLIELETGLNIDIMDDLTWNQAYNSLLVGESDVLFGANMTPERLKFMSFTTPVDKYSYVAFVNKTSNIRTIGELDNKRIGFVEGDVAIELFSDFYKNIIFEVVIFEEQLYGLMGLENNEIDGFITSGGGIVYDFMYHYPEVKRIAEIQGMTSDMTLSTLTENNQILAEIISKVINYYQDKEIATYIQQAETAFNTKLLKLTDEEYKWLSEDGEVVVGVVSDYLPFDYYDNNEYKGIAGEILKEIEAIIGIKYKYIYGDFDEIYKKALTGEVEVLNIAKTEERLNNFIFPRSFSQERDLIYGKKNATYVQDIYGLEDKKVAVIKGFWQEELLKKNLNHVDIIITDNIKESIKLVNKGKADYFIENPTVAEFYISGLGYWNVVRKGETSTDSFLYFGVNKGSPIVASLMDKALTLVDYDMAKQRGLNSVPSLMSRNDYYMIIVILSLMVVIVIGGVILVKIIKSLIKEKETSAVLKDRAHMMYLDPLTGLNNRLYYNFIVEKLSDTIYPQTVIMSDLNNLKVINDTMGHHAGDAYIKTFGELLKENVGDAVICRMGGDEFIIIKSNCNKDEAELLIHTLKTKSEKNPVDYENDKVGYINAAYGYAIRYNDDVELETVKKEADNNMYAHKKACKEIS